ncbi:hypothetical protein GGS24DRAFT_439600 [Hypoxylon argillaceum]|nr:hypothetical protein GGS24DRAFT_439600 [Hypoxylon argillaceum]KAI1157172.1 hypothetical protein F4825DRAFT_400933 [Nemania diffusa]
MLFRLSMALSVQAATYVSSFPFCCTSIGPKMLFEIACVMCSAGDVQHNSEDCGTRQRRVGSVIKLIESSHEYKRIGWLLVLDNLRAPRSIDNVQL